ncbi:MAG: hypothetical protein JW864_08405 [Spirochaetes bacterium]|nr:hypothetical protein [Spirochaetota bacterium]
MISVTDFSRFSINLLGKQINCSIPDNNFLHDTFTLNPQADNPDATLTIREADGPLRSNIETSQDAIIIDIEGENAFNMNMFRSYIGFLIHYLTPAFFIHGCGIYSILTQTGILLIGNEGSGKTTLSREIPSSQIIDDDQILLHENKLVPIGKKSAHTVQKRSVQKVVYEDKGYLATELELIFILTKEMKGGQVKKIPAESILKDPSLVWHHNLCTLEQPNNYCEDKEVPDVPAFLIGTDENKSETINAVLDKINSVLKRS